MLRLKVKLQYCSVKTRCVTATLPVCVRGIAMSPRFIAVISVTHGNYHER